MQGDASRHMARYQSVNGRMKAYERTRRSIRNSFTAIALQVVSLLIGFFSRKVFLDYLGTEVLGLNSTATGILSFLNLAELGLESAVAVSLYKPLYDNDRCTVHEIIAIQGWLYKRIAIFIICCSAVLMPFFPLIFSKMQLPMWYAYASFAALLFSSLLGYFTNYKQVILTADQNDFRLQISFRGIMVLKVAAQMAAVCLLPHPYVWWIALEVIFAVAAAISLNRTVYRNYPYLKEKCDVGMELLRKYPDVVTKVKQVFVKRIAFFITVQAAPIFIYTFSDLTQVAYYGNYMVLINSVQAVLMSLFSGLSASVGNMIAENDDKLTIKVFREIFTIRFFLVSFCSFCFIVLAGPFVSLWLGRQYVLPDTTLWLIVAIFYLNMMQHSIDVFLDACGLFSDVWSSYVRLLVYFPLALVLGRMYGLNGILAATVAELLLIDFIWKPVFLFKSGLRHKYSLYAVMYSKFLMSLVVSLAVTLLLMRLTGIDAGEDYCSLLIYALLHCSIFGILLFAILYATERGMRTFVERMLKTFKTR